MSAKLYVGSLAYSVDDAKLKAMFDEFGTVDSAKVVVDRDSSQSKGFGFVEMSSEEEAQAAIKGLHGKEVEGRTLTVNVARPQVDRPRSFGGGRRY